MNRNGRINFFFFFPRPASYLHGQCPGRLSVPTRCYRLYMRALAPINPLSTFTRVYTTRLRARFLIKNVIFHRRYIVLKIRPDNYDNPLEAAMKVY